VTLQKLLADVLRHRRFGIGRAIRVCTCRFRRTEIQAVTLRDRQECRGFAIGRANSVDQQASLASDHPVIVDVVGRQQIERRTEAFPLGRGVNEGPGALYSR
jgi:hypothetical protein